MLCTLAYQPALLTPFLGFAAAIALQGTLPRRDSELLALRTAWNCRSVYEWGHHVLYAREAGLSDPEIGALTRSIEGSPWQARERLLVRATDHLCADHTLPADLWEELARVLSEAERVELPIVVGQYAMLSMVANATGMRLEPGVPGWPAGVEG